MTNSPLHVIVSRLASASARHRRLTLAAWLTFVIGCFAAASAVGTHQLSDAQSDTGSSARGLSALVSAGLSEPASESVLVEGASPAAVRAAATDLQARLHHDPAVFALRGPAQDPSLLSHGGRDGLVVLDLHGQESDSVVGVQHAVAAVARDHPHVQLFEAGDGSISRAISNGIGSDFHRAELFAIPVTLIILVIAFGALVAACVPLLLGLTSIAAALGAVGALSHIVPEGQTTSSAVLLIGLAVGVDYSLFYMRREREERLAGRDQTAALRATTATVGHAVVVSGLTVIVAMAGLLLTGSSTFTSIALGTMLVVAIAVIGSVTVLPATLAMLGDRINRGRLWRPRRRARRGEAWRRIASVVVAHPRVALAAVVVALAPLAFGVLTLHTSGAGLSDLPPGSSVLTAEHAIERAFPGGWNTADIVIDARGSHEAQSLSTPTGRATLARLGTEAIRATGAGGAPGVRFAPDTRVAEVSVPLPGSGTDARTMRALAVLREHVLPSARRAFPGTAVDLTGQSPSEADFNALMRGHAPLVIGFVLVLGFCLLLAAFRSVRMAGAILALNLLSVGAAFGAMVYVFQGHWAQGLLGFTSNGAIVSWLPLFAFAVLFGLSMDYTVLIVARIQEGVRRGLPARQAATDAVAATAGVVSSAAIVMIAVFSVFATLSALEFKEAGVGLALAILIDATLVRAVALPAAITLFADRSWGSRRHATAQVGERATQSQQPAADVESTTDAIPSAF